MTTSKAHNMSQYVYIHRHLFFPLHSSVWRSPCPLYRTSSLFAFIEDYRLPTENNISITSYIVYRKALQSYRYINKYLLIKYLIVSTRQLFARVSVTCCRNVSFVAWISALSGTVRCATVRYRSASLQQLSWQAWVIQWSDAAGYFCLSIRFPHTVLSRCLCYCGRSAPSAPRSELRGRSTLTSRPGHDKVVLTEGGEIGTDTTQGGVCRQRWQYEQSQCSFVKSEYTAMNLVIFLNSVTRYAFMFVEMEDDFNLYFNHPFG